MSRHTLVVEGRVVHTLSGGAQGPQGPAGPTGSSNVADSTHAATSKTTPVDDDELPLADSAAAWALKKLTWANLKAGVFAAWGALVAAGTSKATPVDADSIALSDSAASNATKKLTWANLKATLLASPTVTGLLTIAGQIKFPATQSASSDPNTLDDYEEGTFTPTLTFGGVSTGITYSRQEGAYTKKGREVSFTLTLFLSAKGSATGAARINGLPFAANSYSAVFLRVDGMAVITGAVQSYIGPAATTFTMEFTNTGTASTVQDTNFTGTTQIMVSGTYIV